MTNDTISRLNPLKAGGGKSPTRISVKKSGGNEHGKKTGQA
jgi:hypothetical protein